MLRYSRQLRRFFLLFMTCRRDTPLIHIFRYYIFMSARFRHVADIIFTCKT